MRSDVAKRASARPVPGWRIHTMFLLVATAVFFLTALPIDAHNVSSTETDLFEVVNDLPGAIYWPMWAVMQVGNFIVVPVLTVIAAILRRVRLTAALAIAGTLVWVLAKVIKDAVERGRPAELVNEVILRHAPAAGNGYISGHAAVAFAIVTVLNPYLSRKLRVVAWTLAVLVCVARIYVGAHLPLDVVGGAAFGLAVGSLISLVLGDPYHRGLFPSSPSQQAKETALHERHHAR
jgi:membrane-associated phospholipid phosphatase